MEEDSSLYETRSVRKGGGSGVGIRLMKGVYVGGYSGKSESHKEWRKLDDGKIILTSKRIIFKGDLENRNIPIEKVLSVTSTLETIEITIEGKEKSSAFSVKNICIWKALIHLIKKVENPLQLGDTEIDIKFQ